MKARIFVQSLLSFKGAPGGCFAVSSDCWSHIAAIRLRERDVVTFFDDTGAEAIAQVACVKTRSLEMIAMRPPPASSSFSIAIAVGFPSIPSRGDFLVEKCAEMGVKTLVPLVTSRCESNISPSKLARYRRLSIAASEQSWRPGAVMEVQQPMRWTEFERFLKHDAQDRIVLWGEMPEPSTPPLFEVLRSRNPGNVICVVGPEGDFDNSEKLSLQSMGQGVSLSNNRLRTETAAVLMSSVVSSWLHGSEAE